MPLLVQLGVFLQRELRGDLGYSLYFNEPVIRPFRERLPATLLLMASQLAFALIVGVSLGIAAARHPYSVIDTASTALALVGYSMPAFWSGLLLILLFSTALGVLPSVGMASMRQPVTGLAAIWDVTYNARLTRPSVSAGRTRWRPR